MCSNISLSILEIKKTRLHLEVPLFFFLHLLGNQYLTRLSGFHFQLYEINKIGADDGWAATKRDAPEIDFSKWEGVSTEPSSVMLFLKHAWVDFQKKTRNKENTQQISLPHSHETKMKIHMNTISCLLYHHCFCFRRLVMWEPQVEDPLHEHLRIAGEVQGVRVVDDRVVGVWIQQHRHVTASSTHLHAVRAKVAVYERCAGMTQCVLLDALSDALNTVKTCFHVHSSINMLSSLFYSWLFKLMKLVPPSLDSRGSEVFTCVNL